MRLILKLLALLILSGVAWTSWQIPQMQGPKRDVRMSIPLFGGSEGGKWRVVTRKLVWKQAAQSMQKRLEQDGFKVTPITRRETVELYAFDDPRTFATRKQAALAESTWRKKGIGADVIKYDNSFGVALGRFFMPEHAEKRRQALEKSGGKYSYEQRTIEIPVYRFTFPAAKRSTAEKLWKHLQELGIADPALIREDRFTALYGSLPRKEQQNEDRNLIARP